MAAFLGTNAVQLNVRVAVISQTFKRALYLWIEYLLVESLLERELTWNTSLVTMTEVHSIFLE